MLCQPSHSLSWNFVRPLCNVWPRWSGGLSHAESCNFLLKILSGRHPLGWHRVLGGRKCRDQWLRIWQRAFQWGHDGGHFWQRWELCAPVWIACMTRGGEWGCGVLLGPLSSSACTAGSRTGTDVCMVRDFSSPWFPTHFQKELKEERKVFHGLESAGPYLSHSMGSKRLHGLW